MRRAVGGRSKQFDLLLQEQRDRRRVACGEKALINRIAAHSTSGNSHTAIPRHSALSETARTPSSLTCGGVVQRVHPALAGSIGTVQPLSARSAETTRCVSQPTSLSALNAKKVRPTLSLLTTLRPAVNSSGAIRFNNPAAGSLQRSLSVDSMRVPCVTSVTRFVS